MSEAPTSATLRPAWVDVDLDALAHNLEVLRRVTNGAVLGVVKADAYGHGSQRVGRFLDRIGIDWLGVALAEEGCHLREAGVEAPILVLSPIGRAQHDLFEPFRLTPLVSDVVQLGQWLEWAASRSAPIGIHLKVDTGMGRLGLAPNEVPEALNRLRESPGLEVTGIASHFAASEAIDDPSNERQESAFREILGLLEADERERVVRHLANSGAALHRPSARFDLVRVGLALYGYDPARRFDQLRPVMSAGCTLEALRNVATGVALGYGGRWRAERPSRVGVLPVGYGDGYPWRLTGAGEVLIRGRRVPTVGAISMDLTLVDVTEAEAEDGDPVVLLGSQGPGRIDAHDLAAWAGTIPYEILTSLGLRLPRRYLQDGVVVETESKHDVGW